MNTSPASINASVSSSLEEINHMKLSYSCLSSTEDKRCFLSMPIAIHMIYSIDHYSWALEDAFFFFFLFTFRIVCGINGRGFIAGGLQGWPVWEDTMNCPVLGTAFSSQLHKGQYGHCTTEIGTKQKSILAPLQKHI